MLTSSVVCDAISFFATRKCQKTQKINEYSWYWIRKSSYLLNDLSNYNDIFRKEVAYDNTKSHKKSGFHSFSRKHIFRKTTVEGGGFSILRVNICWYC